MFQVGPTVYRGLWIVDGNFLLEAARYLGYDKEADEGLRAEWAKQLPTGQMIAAVPGEHWKDTAIAMFTLVRQCELKQDFSDFRELEPNVRKAIEFLRTVQQRASTDGSTNGKYGLLAPGFADGGISGVRSEFTNTVWTLAGLKAVARAAADQQNASLASAAGSFYAELRESFERAAAQEMIQHGTVSATSQCSRTMTPCTAILIRGIARARKAHSGRSPTQFFPAKFLIARIRSCRARSRFFNPARAKIFPPKRAGCGTKAYGTTMRRSPRTFISGRACENGPRAHSLVFSITHRRSTAGAKSSPCRKLWSGRTGGICRTTGPALNASAICATCWCWKTPRGCACWREFRPRK